MGIGDSVMFLFEDDDSAVSAEANVDMQVLEWGANVHSTASDEPIASSIVRLEVTTEDGDDDDGTGRRQRRRLKVVSRGASLQAQRRRRRRGRALLAKTTQKWSETRHDEAGDDAADEPLTVVLQNSEPMDYETTSSELVTLVCPSFSYRGNVSGWCSSLNTSVVADCDGTWARKNVTCAAVMQPSCLYWSSAAMRWDSTSCVAVNWTRTNTTCECTPGGGDDDEGSGGGIDLSDVEFASSSMALTVMFAGMASANPFSADALLKNLTVLITFGVFMLISAFFAYFGYLMDIRDAHAAAVEAVEGCESEESSDDSNEARDATAERPILDRARRVSRACFASLVSIASRCRGLYTGRGGGGGGGDGADGRRQRRRRSGSEADRKELMESSMPDWVAEESGLSLWLSHVTEEHEWLSIWFVYDEVAPRPIRSIMLYTETVWMMAAEALAYTLAYPDLGCAEFVNEADCLGGLSPLPEECLERNPRCEARVAD